MSGYRVPAAEAHTEIEIKKSRFLAYSLRVDSRADAMAAVEHYRARYPDARHHCWAYLLGSPGSPTSAAMSDDGEPSGTAGKPILNVIQHNEVGNVLVVVVRYFGGVKLGAGGLVRAYSQSAQSVYDCLELELLKARSAYTVRIDFPREPALRHWLTVNDGELLEAVYDSSVQIRLALEPEKLAELNGLVLRWGGEIVYPELD